MLLAINTGQRQGDLLRLPWSAYDGKHIKLRQRKTGAYVPIPVTDELKAALDATPRQSPIMLTNSEGKPWSESGFQGAWGKATMRAGIRGLTFHDLRGTAVVTLARAGCNEVEIYSITGHKPSDVRAILTAHYLPQDAEVAGNAIAKLNRYKTRRDQTEDKILPTALPTASKIVKLKTGESVTQISWLGRQDSNLGMAESKSKWFALFINARSEKSREFDLNPFKSLADISECRMHVARSDDDALPSEGRGHKFKSCRARQRINGLAGPTGDEPVASYPVATKLSKKASIDRFMHVPLGRRSNSLRHGCCRLNLGPRPNGPIAWALAVVEREK